MSFDIAVKGIKASGCHGVYEFEKKEKQEFIVDVLIKINEIKSDDINQTLNYENVISIAKEVVASKSFDLIEILAQTISNKIISVCKQELSILSISVSVHKPNTELNYVFNICEEKLDTKKIFAKIVHEWGRVETNYKLMNLHESVLDDNEKSIILDIVKEDIPDLQTGAFLHLLDTDKIEGITKNTEGWLENFRGLTVFKK